MIEPTKAELEYIHAFSERRGVVLTEDAARFAVLLLRANEEQLALAIRYLRDEN